MTEYTKIMHLVTEFGICKKHLGEKYSAEEYEKADKIYTLICDNVMDMFPRQK